MLSKNQISRIRALHQKKVRDSEKLFLAEGVKLTEDLLNSEFRVKEVYYLEGKFNPPDKKETSFIPVSFSEMERLTALSSPSPVLAVAEMAEPVKIIFAKDELILVLDDIRDPGNLGTIIRIADWFGISKIITSETSVDLYNPKVVQSTMGSIARVDVISTNLVRFLKDIPPETEIYGTFMEGENIFTTGLNKSGIIVIGSEANGISPETESFVTTKLSVPSFADSSKNTHPESLNASVAAAIVCAEFRRRAFSE